LCKFTDVFNFKLQFQQSTTKAGSQLDHIWTNVLGTKCKAGVTKACMISFTSISQSKWHTSCQTPFQCSIPNKYHVYLHDKNNTLHFQYRFAVSWCSCLLNFQWIFFAIFNISCNAINILKPFLLIEGFPTIPRMRDLNLTETKKT
jgi:hypothetical protein